MFLSYKTADTKHVLLDKDFFIKTDLTDTFHCSVKSLVY